jgi:hypothetical protein
MKLALAIGLAAMFAPAFALATETAARDVPQGPLLTKSLDVVSHNASEKICHGDIGASRPDRKALAKLVAAIPDPSSRYEWLWAEYNLLDFAVLADDAVLVDRLYTLGIRPLPGNEALVLQTAVQYGSPDVIKALIRHGVSFDTKDPPPIVLAVLAGQRANVEALIDAGVNINAPYSSKNPEYTALTAAVICKDQALVSLLLNDGAKVTQLTVSRASKSGIQLLPAEREGEVDKD